MYRKRNGSLGFSFTNFANAAVPNLFADPPPAGMDRVWIVRRDMLYAHQIASANPYNLDERSFFVAGITESEASSKKVFKALQKNNVLGPDGQVDTCKIGPNFAHQLAILNHVRQKESVNMLFWWEEECQRLKKLNAEDQELADLIRGMERDLKPSRNGDENEDEGLDRDTREMLDRLKFARERVKMKIRQRPSQRRPDVEADTDNIADAFHGVGHGRAMSAPGIVSGIQQHDSGEAGKHNNERPPEYYP